jgi:hypothetical protein
MCALDLSLSDPCTGFDEVLYRIPLLNIVLLYVQLGLECTNIKIEYFKQKLTEVSKCNFLTMDLTENV